MDIRLVVAWVWATPDRRAFARAVLGAVVGAVATSDWKGALVGVAGLLYEYLTKGNPHIGIGKKPSGN